MAFNIKTKNMFLLFSVSVLFMCCSSLVHTKLLLFPPEDFKLDSKILKSNGYYYSEKERGVCCKYISGITTGVVADTATLYLEKYISAFFLYADGFAYFTGGFLTTGVNRPGATSSIDWCNLVKDYNTYFYARENFENYLKKKTIGNNSKQDKGMFTIKNSLIKFQIYQSGSQSLVLNEYEGEILNDSTFKIYRKTVYPNTMPKTKPKITQCEDIYHFKKFDIKVDSSCYLRDNRIKYMKQ